VLVGGLDRMQNSYKEVCCKYGCRVKVFTQMTSKFDKVIGNPDCIILFTGTVSHKMIALALKEAKRKNIPVIRCHNSSLTSLDGILNQIKRGSFCNKCSNNDCKGI
jgi:hypothetical protein